MKNLLHLSSQEAPVYSRIILKESLASTNALGQELLSNPDAKDRESLGLFSLISTTQQTQGKGRLDRVWTTPPDTALSTSFIIRPHATNSGSFPVESFHRATLLLALVTVNTIERLGVTDAQIKWPNDVLLGEHKCCGILAQLVVEPDGKYSMVAGVGINVNQQRQDLPVETATSLHLQSGMNYDLNQVLTILAEEFARIFTRFIEINADPTAPLVAGSSLLDLLRDRMITLGQKVNIHLPQGTIESGTAIDINNDGEILIQDCNGHVNSYAVGDIVHLRPQP